MKRSKIFLLLTTGCLAAVGLFASKANHFNKWSGFYYTKDLHCAISDPVCVKNDNSTVTCVNHLTAGKVYTKRIDATHCSTPLHYLDL